MPFRVTSLNRTTSPKRKSVGLPDVTRQPQPSRKGAVETEMLHWIDIASLKLRFDDGEDLHCEIVKRGDGFV
jgi:hypothetical protein